MKHFGKILTIVIFTLSLVFNTEATEGYKKTTINGTECYIYYVQPGEGFYSIGRKFGVTRDEVVKFNPTTKNGLNKGAKLYIPTITQTNSDSSQSGVLPTTHIVKAGESLYAISKRYNISINDIKTLNNLNSNSIKVGQVLIVSNTNTQKQEEYQQSTVKEEEGIKETVELKTDTLLKDEVIDN